MGINIRTNYMDNTLLQSGIKKTSRKVHNLLINHQRRTGIIDRWIHYETTWKEHSSSSLLVYEFLELIKTTYFVDLIVCVCPENK